MKGGRLLALIGPGLMVAATGVGAGDLATAAFTGDRLGVAILWAVVAGALMKFVLNEGIARWQLATGTTLLDGVAERLGRACIAGFLAYFLLWSFFVGSALISACGVALQGMLPFIEDPNTGKVVYGLLSSAAGVLLVRLGGFRLFERVMSVTIGVMFVTVVVTAVLLCNDVGAVARGLVRPMIPDIRGEGLEWTVALMGGVGGTVTVLCYGYWIREHGRERLDALRTCRIDLAVGYVTTAVFGVAMVVIGSRLHGEARGAGLIVALANQLQEPLGSGGRWLFLLGAFGAVFSSLLGVWQAVPYLFADILRLLRRDETPVDTGGRAYRGYLFALAVIPAAGLALDFRAAQKLYAVSGALFIPLLAVVLLLLGRARWSGVEGKNGPFAVGGLVLTLAVFLLFAWFNVT